MEQMLIYTLKSALVLTLLYLPYTLMLRRERFFRMNRTTLLGILGVALIFPLCKTHVPEVTDRLSATIANTQIMVYRAEAVITASGADSSWGLMEWIAFVYVAGLALVVAFRLWQVMQIRRIIRSGSLWRQREADGITIYCHEGNEPPLSWMRSIVISQYDYNNNPREMLHHERAHIGCHHSFDILLLMVVEAVQWWNPLVYVLGSSLRDIHEYEADNHVLSQGVELQAYQQLLVRKALAGTSCPFANNFNRSSIAKRIAMMRRPDSSPWMRSKLLLLLPLAMMALVVAASPVIEPLFIIDGVEATGYRYRDLPEDSIHDVQVLLGSVATTFYGDKGLGGVVIVNTKEWPTDTAMRADDDEAFEVFVIAEEMPRFVGDGQTINEYINQHLVYPPDAVNQNVEADVDVRFVVERDGSLTDIVAVVHSTNQPHQEQALLQLCESAEQLVAGMPPWKPARQQGRNVRARAELNIMYRLQ